MTEGTSGVVLAGGASRRMGAVDKRSVLVDGRPLLVAAVEALASVCDEVLVVTAGEPPPVTASGARVVFDRRADAGPLAGIEAGLLGAAHPRVLVLAGDHPAAAPGVLAELLARLAADDHLDAVVLGTDDGPQPLVGAYRRSAAAAVTRVLDTGQRRARALLDALAVEVVEVAAWTDLDPAKETAVDLDTPEDLAAWQARG
jgi:molybdenum cofactor guanylyltransferase